MNSGSHDAIAAVRVEAEQALRPVVLEHQHEQAVRRSHREQVQEHGLDRDHDRPERDQHQQEAEHEHEPEDERHVALHLVVEVVRAGRLAGGRGLDAGKRADGRRNQSSRSVCSAATDVALLPSPTSGIETIADSPARVDLDVDRLRRSGRLRARACRARRSPVCTCGARDVVAPWTTTSAGV